MYSHKLLFPCNYTDSGDAQIGYLNDAFVTAAKEHPETYLCVPTPAMRRLSTAPWA